MVSKRTLSTAAAIVAAGISLVSVAAAEQDFGIGSAISDSSSSPAASGGHTTAAELEELLDVVDVVDERPQVDGYERDCGSAGACVFGQAWSDDHAGAGGRNGCDTRNDVLARDLAAVELKPGTDDCVVLAGVLDDPYTGATITFTREDARAVQIDHLYPLAAAWDLGASAWPLERRVQFANDQDLNLLAVDGSANASKGDRTPGEWVPINRAHVCDYLAGYLDVAIAYDLPITAADVDAVQAGADTCRSQR